MAAAADSAGGQERCHGKVDRFLCRRERLVGRIGPAEAVNRFFGEALRQNLEIVGRNNAVAVEENEHSAARAFYAVVSRDRTSFVGFGVVVEIEPAGICVAYISAGQCRAVFDDYCLEVAICLFGEACQKILDFGGTVIDRYYY